MKKILILLATILTLSTFSQSTNNFFNVKLYGCVGNGVIDDQQALNNLLNTVAPSGSTIYFPIGTYSIGSTIILTDKRFNFTSDFATITSSNNAPTFSIVSTSSTSPQAINWRIKDLIFSGSSTGNLQCGFNFVQYAGNFEFINCTFSNYGASGIGCGIKVASTQLAVTLGGTISNCRFYSNYIGILLDTRGEYINIDACTLTSNNTAIFMSSGNDIINDNNINYNQIGVYAVSGSNNAHGIITNNNMNHNVSYGLRLEDQTYGWIISNNDIYQGFIKFKNCNGITVLGGTMDCDNYEYDNNIGCTFNTVKFDSGYVNSTTLTSGQPPLYINCRKINGSIATSPNTFLQSIRDAAITSTVFGGSSTGTLSLLATNSGTNGVVRIGYSSGNYNIITDNSDLIFNNSNSIQGNLNNINVFSIFNNSLTTSGIDFFKISPISFQKSSLVEASKFHIGARTLGFPSGGTLPLQRDNWIEATTYTAAASVNATDIFAFKVDAGILGTNVTASNNWAAGFEGSVKIKSITSNKFLEFEGTSGQKARLSADGAGVYYGSATNTSARFIINNGVFNPIWLQTTGFVNIESKMCVGSTSATPGATLTVLGTFSCTQSATVAANSMVGTNQIGAVLTGTATLDFTSTASQTSSEFTVTVTGAVDGDPVEVGVINSVYPNDCLFSARVSATDTVSIRFNNYSSSAIDPSSGNFKVVVFKN